MMTDRERWQYWKAVAERLEAERDAALDQLDELHGRPFSQRVYLAMLARAERAEAESGRLREALLRRVCRPIVEVDRYGKPLPESESAERGAGTPSPPSLPRCPSRPRRSPMPNSTRQAAMEEMAREYGLEPSESLAAALAAAKREGAEAMQRAAAPIAMRAEREFGCWETPPIVQRDDCCGEAGYGLAVIAAAEYFGRIATAIAALSVDDVLEGTK